jgi:hypothetical protein
MAPELLPPSPGTPVLDACIERGPEVLVVASEPSTLACSMECQGFNADLAMIPSTC